MPRNVEIKARIRGDFNTFVDKVKHLSYSDGTLLRQEDTFFYAPAGRLKLRRIHACTLEDDISQLIFYNRPDKEGPKLSEYTVAEVTDAENLQKVLSEALGVKACVKKHRLLFLVGQTRIHIDQVEDLGNFIELEVVLSEDETSEYGQRVAESLMEKLNIAEDDLLATAYADMLAGSFDNSK